MKRNSLIIMIAFITGIITIGGCKKSPVVPKVAEKNVVSTKISEKQIPSPSSVATVQPQANTVTVTSTSTYYYNPAGKPDPFEPFDISKVKPTTALTPLQQFSLDQLTVRGIIWGVSNAKAIIEDPTGKTYIVGVGTKIGKNNGVIIRILNDKIVVLEQYTDVFTGKIKTNEVTMELKKTQKI